MPQPIAMFNALAFRPDGGREMYEGGYGPAVLPLLAKVGAELLVPFLPVEQDLEGRLDVDAVGVVRYPSVEAFDAMWQGEAYRAVAHLRTDATRRAVLTQCEIEPVDAQPMVPEPGVVVVNALWFRAGRGPRYDDYLAAARPLVEGIGGRFLTPRLRPVAARDDDFVPDLIFFGWYPSQQALFGLLETPGYAEAARIRDEAVERSSTTLLGVGTG